VAGAACVGVGLFARRHLDPASVDWNGMRYDVVMSEDASSRTFKLKSQGRAVASVSGATDTLCDQPYTMWIDVDGDGMNDLYVHRCPGHGYLRNRRGSIEFVDLGQWNRDDAPVLSGWWASAIRSGGVQWIIIGSVAMIISLTGFVLSFIPLRSR
jgi:hypothetical protein